MQQRLPIWVLAPSSADKRRGVARRLTFPSTRESYDDEEMKSRLRSLRLECLERREELRARLVHTLAKRCVETIVADDARAAASYITSECGSADVVAVNRSAVVGEVLPHLANLGIEAHVTYDDQFAQPTEAASKYWQITRPEADAAWAALASFQAASEALPEEGYMALLGVNAVSAGNGAVFFAQHLQNITEMLTRASKLVLLIGLNKIVPDEETARLITRAMVRFGALSIALSLGKKGGGRPIPRSALTNRQEVKVVLLDNGRLAWLDTPFESLFTCIGCRACAQECPTFPYFAKEAGWTPRDYLAAFLRGEAPSLEMCTWCGRCGASCPVGIDLPALFAKARSRQAVALTEHLLARVETLFKVSSATAPLSNLALQTGLVRVPLERFAGIDRRRNLPVFRHPTTPRSRVARSRSVAYYYGCYVNYVDPELGQATVNILEHNGYHVATPRQACCGLVAFAYGDLATAKRQAEHTVEVLYPFVAKGLTVLVTCPSCGLALTHDIAQILGESVETRLIAERTREVTNFLLELRSHAELRTDFSPLALAAGYHVPCHLRVRGKGSEVPRLLELVPQLSLKTVDCGCCGMSGSFGLKKKHYDISMEIGSNLFASLREEGVQEAITDCPACEMQIRAGSGLRVRHPLKLLWQSYAAASSRRSADTAVAKNHTN